MGIALNFGQEEKKKIMEFLKKFESINITPPFEEYRCKIKESTITLYHTGRLVIQGRDQEKIKEFLLENLALNDELIIGFDEVGRGEKSGSFVIGFVVGKKNTLLELRDSKKTNDLQAKYEIVSKNSLAYGSIAFSAQQMDEFHRQGKTINQVEEKTIESIASLLGELFPSARIIVDGDKMNIKNKKIEFLPKADDLIPAVGAASIVAKLEREKSSDKEKRLTWKTKKK